jgi:hypothetical protein
MNKVIPIQSRDQVTQTQVGTVLSAIVTVLPLLNRHEAFNNQMDEGTVAVVEGTLINACDRLNKILNDDSRWGIEGQCRLENHLANFYHEHTKTLKLQQQQIYELAKPHTRHNPQLGRLNDGTWIAFLGDIDDINNAIVGVGGCPAQALEAFDEMFNGRVPSHLQAWIAVREEALQNGLQPPTKDQYDKSQNLDGAGTHGTEEIENGGPNGSPDRGEAGPDHESGGDQAGPPPAGPKGPVVPS